MSATASQTTRASIVCSIVCSGADQRKHQSSASLAFVRGIHRRPVNSPHKGPVTRKMFPIDDVINNWVTNNAISPGLRDMLPYLYVAFVVNPVDSYYNAVEGICYWHRIIITIIMIMIMKMIMMMMMLVIIMIIIRMIMITIIIKIMIIMIMMITIMMMIMIMMIIMIMISIRWDICTHPYPSSNGGLAAVEFRTWMNYYILLFCVYVITYPYLNPNTGLANLR